MTNICVVAIWKFTLVCFESNKFVWRIWYGDAYQLRQKAVMENSTPSLAITSIYYDVIINSEFYLEFLLRTLLVRKYKYSSVSASLFCVHLDSPRCYVSRPPSSIKLRTELSPVDVARAICLS